MTNPIAVQHNMLIWFGVILDKTYTVRAVEDKEWPEGLRFEVRHGTKVVPHTEYPASVALQLALLSALSGATIKRNEQARFESFLHDALQGIAGVAATTAGSDRLTSTTADSYANDAITLAEAMMRRLRERRGSTEGQKQQPLEHNNPEGATDT